MSQDTKQLKERLRELKEERNAVILAHNYQIPEVQDAADYIGDSFQLSRLAASTDADVIVFAGVHFMAESAYILAPDKTVLLPEPNAGCPMANMVTVEALREKKKEHPHAAVVTYVNSSAAVKAESDVCVTSSNVLEVVESLDTDEILFVPDMNMAHWLAKQTDKKIIPWYGFCRTHHLVRSDDIRRTQKAHPDAITLVHPECRPEVVEAADHVLSTGGILRYARETDYKKLIIGTEEGLIYRLKQENPDKEFILPHEKFICYNMKKTTLSKVVWALETMIPVVTVPEEIRGPAKEALDRMLSVLPKEA